MFRAPVRGPSRRRRQEEEDGGEGVIAERVGWNLKSLKKPYNSTAVQQ
jgi:hypothetical protein